MGGPGREGPGDDAGARRLESGPGRSPIAMFAIPATAPSMPFGPAAC